MVAAVSLMVSFPAAAARGAAGASRRAAPLASSRNVVPHAPATLGGSSPSATGASLRAAASRVVCMAIPEKVQRAAIKQARREARKAAAPTERAVVHLNYESDWQKPTIMYSVGGGPWVKVPFQVSRPKPGEYGVSLPPGFVDIDPNAPKGPRRQVYQCAISLGASTGVEFVLSDGAGHAFEKAEDGNNFLVTEPGNYLVKWGKVQKVSNESYLCVTDLDGTMVGDDAATGAFKEYWEGVAASRGAKLCYSTGRSLQQFMDLCDEKRGLLAQPDVLVSAVGTKVYNWASAAGGGWEEDKVWSKALDVNWNRGAVHGACETAIEHMGDDRMHFRPKEEQNEHKVTVGLRAEDVGRVESLLADLLADQGVQFKAIVSGEGEWRFIDVVPTGAGQRESLEYVRSRFGFMPDKTVACGDSGNDLHMFDGDNLAIVVGNAQEEVRRWVEERQLTGGGRLVMASASMAAGILEGLQAHQLY